MDALWNDDFHHAAPVALARHNEAYNMDYRGTPQEFISSAKRGFLYQGQRYAWQKKTRGSSTAGLNPERFINYLQNHDQVANSLRGLRAHQLVSGSRFRALTALLLLPLDIPAGPKFFSGY
jgi:maltooligosyltrehalose trehalohydrolase